MWGEIQDLDKKIERLRAKVRLATEPSPASSRELVTLIAQEISCVEDELDEKVSTLYNGSGESYLLYRLSVNVTAKELTNDSRISLSRYAFGYMRGGIAVRPSTAIAAILPVGPFDFVWNYSVSSRQSYYSRQPLGSTVFNGLERAQAFNLYEPLILKPADAIEFRMKPTAYALPGTQFKTEGRVYFVNFLAFGYRRPL
jgi:hypothetical protein